MMYAAIAASKAIGAVTGATRVPSPTWRISEPVAERAHSGNSSPSGIATATVSEIRHVGLGTLVAQVTAPMSFDASIAAYIIVTKLSGVQLQFASAARGEKS